MRFSASWLLLLTFSACGRIRFDPHADPHAADAAVDASVDAPFAGANRVFVTNAVFTGDLGGLAGADATCAAAASSAGLTGTFVAWLSTSTTDAIDRLAGSRGWVRTDGVAVIDTIAAAIGSDQMFAQIDRDELGVRVSYGNPGAWSDCGPDGRSLGSFGSCMDWTDGTNASTGLLTDVTAAGSSFSYSSAGIGCTQNAHLICFETGHDVAIALPSQPIMGRLAFVSTPVTAGGLSAFDARCASDATAHALPGTYLAAVATMTTTIASRFALDARPVQRLDGTVIAASIADLLSRTDLLAPANQLADGSYTTFQTSLRWTGAQDPIVVGAAAQTCNDWTDMTSSANALLGNAESASYEEFWRDRFENGSAFAICDGSFPVLCLQQ